MPGQVYTIKNHKTGKSYEMPWDGDSPPSTMDAAKFMDEQDGKNLSPLEKIDKFRSTPLTSYLPDDWQPGKLAEKYAKPLTDEGMAHPEGIKGFAKKYGGAFLESLANQGEQATRPDMLAVTAATLGAGSVAGAGWGKTATAMGLPARVLSGKMAYEGAKDVYNAPDTSGKVAGGIQSLLGAAGAAYNPANRGALPMGKRDIAPEPYGPDPLTQNIDARPNRQTGMANIPWADVTDRPYVDAEPIPPGVSGRAPRAPLGLPPAGPPEPPPPPPPASIAPQGLPPARQTFYGGPMGGPVSTNMGEIPTRRFEGAPATNRSIFTRGRSTPIRETEPAMLRETTPGQAGPMRDILEQNSPYNRLMGGEAQQPPSNSPQFGGPGQRMPVLPDLTALAPPPEPPPIVPEAPPAAPVKPPRATRGKGKGKIGKLFQKVAGEQGAIGDIQDDPLFKQQYEAARDDPRHMRAPLEEPVTAETLQSLKGGDIVPGSSGRRLLDTSRPYSIWQKETEAMGYKPDEIALAKKVADHFGEDITRSDDLHDFNTYMEGKHGQAYVDHVDKLMGEDSTVEPPTSRLKNVLADETGAIGNVKDVKASQAAAKLAKLFGSPTDEEMHADLAGRKRAIPDLTSDLSPDIGGRTMEQPARKMPLRERLSKKEMALRKLAGEGWGKAGNETGSLKMWGKGLKKPFTSSEPPLSEAAKQLKKENHFRTKDWSTRRAAADIHGEMEGQNFADLKAGGMKLLEQYRAGDRSGRLADVQKWADDLFDAEQAAGLKVSTKTKFMDAMTKPQFVGKGGVSLPRGLKPPATYLEGTEMGLSPKFDNLADLIKDRTRRSKVAIANKQLDSYLEETNQKRPETFDKDGNPVYASVNNPSRLSLTGPEADTIKELVHNVHMDPNKHWKTSGLLAGKSKNLTLTGGIPGTPLNMHGSNIARTMFQSMGAEGVKNWVKGVVNPKWLDAEGKRLRPLRREALDYGYQSTAGEAESSDAFHEWLNKYPIGRAANGLLEFQEKWFEDPLFKRALPVWKDQVLEARVNELTKRGGMDRATILRKASEQANDFMGGQNRTLRNKDIKNQAQTFILAPDWAESQLNTAVKGYKAMAGKEDPIYRKAMLRSGGLRAIGGAIQAGSNTKKDDDWSDIGLHPGDLTTLGLGKTAAGRFRELPMYGNASEGLRFPEEIIRAAASGDWSAGAKIFGNRLSQPAQTAMNLIRAQDVYGNPMTGKDKFGRQISGKTTLLNYLDELTKPITPQPAQAAFGLLRGKIGPEEAFMQSIEAPLKYSAPPKPARGGGRQRVRARARAR